MRIALGLEYDGSSYFGWQRQHEVPSVQEHLEVALAKVAAHPVQVVCAGRTDAGVHATGQVVHFDTDSERSPRAWTLGVNTHLPDGIAVQWMAPVPDNFSARFSATARRYRYLLHNGALRPGIGGKAVTHYYPPLDADAMHDAAQCLIGEQDFSSFRAAQCQSNTPNRNIHFIHVCRLGDYVIVDIQANAFVHHMVRNIVGSLCLVGRGEQDKAWLEDVLTARDRTLAAATAKPNGLYLVDVLYPDYLGLPKTALGPLFLPDQLATV